MSCATFTVTPSNPPHRPAGTIREARSSGRFRGALRAETHSWYVAHPMARPGAFDHTRLQHGLDPPHAQPGGTGLAHLPLAGSPGLPLIRSHLSPPPQGRLSLIRSHLSPPPQGRPPFRLHFSIPFFPLTCSAFILSPFLTAVGPQSSFKLHLTGVKLLKDVVSVSAAQQSESAIHIQISCLP